MLWRSSEHDRDVVEDARRLNDAIIKVPASYGPKMCWWVLYDRERPVAFCGVSVRRHRGESRAVMYRSGVLPGYRGRGLHAEMVRMREEWAALRGCRGASCRVNAVYNVRAWENMVRCGYRTVRRRSVWALLFKRLPYAASVLPWVARVPGGQRGVRVEEVEAAGGAAVRAGGVKNRRHAAPDGRHSPARRVPRDVPRMPR